MNTKIKNLILKVGLTSGLVLAVFLLWGLANEVEAAGAEFKINSHAGSMSRDQQNTAVAVDSQNRFYIVWENETIADRFDIFGRIFDSNGNAITTDSGALANEH